MINLKIKFEINDNVTKERIDNMKNGIQRSINKLIIMQNLRINHETG